MMVYASYFKVHGRSWKVLGDRWTKPPDPPPPPRRELLQCNVFAYMPGYGCGRDAVYLSTMPPGPGI